MNRYRLAALIGLCWLVAGCQAIDNDPVLGDWSKPARPKGSAFPELADK